MIIRVTQENGDRDWGEDTYTDCDECGERFWNEFQRFIRTVELPGGKCRELCITCEERKESE